MKKDLVSIIVPVYNASKYLENCLNSILKQTYNNIEVILIDDGSTDNSLEICKEYKKNDKRIKIIHKENGGISSVRNLGVKESKGKYICFVDSDDYIEKDYVEVLYSGIKKYKTKLCFGGYRNVYNDGTAVDKFSNKTYKLSKVKTLNKLLYVDGVDVSPWSKIYEKSLFDDITYPEGRIFEDTATTYKLIDKCDNIAICDYPIYNYCIRSSSITSSKFNIKKMDWIISSIEMTHYLKKKYKELNDACLAYMMYAHIGVLSSLAMNDKNYKKERKELVLYVKSNRKKYIKDKNVSKKYKLVANIISFNYGLFKIFLKIYQKIIVKRYE